MKILHILPKPMSGNSTKEALLEARGRNALKRKLLGTMSRNGHTLKESASLVIAEALELSQERFDAVLSSKFPLGQSRERMVSFEKTLDFLKYSHSRYSVPRFAIWDWSFSEEEKDLAASAGVVLVDLSASLESVEQQLFEALGLML